MKIFVAYLLGFFILAFLIYNGLKSENPESGQIEFRHELIADVTPEVSGSNYETPALADFEQDGDLNYAYSITRSPIF